jgi:hypothetical protein
MNSLEKSTQNLNVDEYVKYHVEKARSFIKNSRLQIVDEPIPNKKFPVLEKILSIFIKKKIKNNDLNVMDDDVIHHIFSFLSPQSLCRVAQTSQRFNKISKSPVLWKNFLRIEDQNLYKNLLKINRYVNWEQVSKMSLKISHLKDKFQVHNKQLKKIKEEQLKIKKIIKIEAGVIGIVALVIFQTQFDIIELEELGAQTLDLDFFIDAS